MSGTVSKVLWALAGVLLIVMGIVIITSPANTVMSLALLLGIAMLVYGISSIVAFIRYRKERYNSGWALVDGILTTLLGLLLLFNQVVSANIIPYIFSMWVMFSGVLRIVSAFDFKKAGFGRWVPILVVGIIGVLFGFFSLWNPLIAAVAISIVIGILFIVQGAAALYMFFVFRKY